LIVGGRPNIRQSDVVIALPQITQTLWWHERHTADPAHAWIRARIAEIADKLDQADPLRPPDDHADEALA
jgi:hypothetical protein